VVYSVFVTTSCVVTAEDTTASTLDTLDPERMGCSGALEAVETGACTGDKELIVEAEGELVGVPTVRGGPKSKPGNPVEFLVEPPSDGVAVPEDVLEEIVDSVLLS
jgi:hypothetical protein